MTTTTNHHSLIVIGLVIGIIVGIFVGFIPGGAAVGLFIAHLFSNALQQFQKTDAN